MPSTGSAGVEAREIRGLGRPGGSRGSEPEPSACRVVGAGGSAWLRACRTVLRV